MALLYGEVILQRFRHPLRHGELPSPDAAFEDVNPLCGDRIRLELRLADGEVEAARFRGDACAIATASADLLAEMIEGRPLREVLAIGRETLLEALRAEIRPSRLGCVTLPLDVLRKAVQGVRGAA
ncbi:MAG: iron-sulfur cluster assembly scaffold protein [Candidatus Rokubacteria bacterium]|nr:iron-sulfur cluster assembly scaffold protein [Candidatus Rokubacteria bacterium]MBI2878789.1 iron-sulfur cluster assembly scaffold protein [Candidatus Rokubacteria bacterium]